MSRPNNVYCNAYDCNYNKDRRCIKSTIKLETIAGMEQIAECKYRREQYKNKESEK